MTVLELCAFLQGESTSRSRVEGCAGISRAQDSALPVLRNPWAMKRSTTQFGIGIEISSFQLRKCRSTNANRAKCTTDVPPTERDEQGLQPEAVIRTKYTTGPGFVLGRHTAPRWGRDSLTRVFFDGLAGANYGLETVHWVEISVETCQCVGRNWRPVANTGQESAAVRHVGGPCTAPRRAPRPPHASGTGVLGLLPSEAVLKHAHELRHFS